MTDQHGQVGGLWRRLLTAFWRQSSHARAWTESHLTKQAL